MKLAHLDEPTYITDKIIKIPTGFLFTGTYSKGQLETLSIGDYGKSRNVKADFLGLHRELNGVANGDCLPIEEKWVITLSTQYGCPQKCTFCAVPNVKFRGNASFGDLHSQTLAAIAKFPNVKYAERLNLHFARMGEPIFNTAVMDYAEWLYANKRSLPLRIETLHPVLTTSCPNYLAQFEERVNRWCRIKNEVYNGQAGMQFSINSTDEAQRQQMFAGKVLTLEQIAKIVDRLPNPVGRKYCLNFAYATSFSVDGAEIARLFDPEKVMCKITPIHNNNECRSAGIETVGGYESYAPYRKPEDSLKSYGFDVLVFVPSMDEEDGAVTCGNVVLGGSDVRKIQPPAGSP